MPLLQNLCRSHHQEYRNRLWPFRFNKPFATQGVTTIHRITPWVALFLLFLSGCGAENSSKQQLAHSIQSANAFFQGEKLYAQVTMAPALTYKIKQLLKHGEPLLATYQFRLIRIHPWLPDTRILQQSIQRHMRIRLITQRYELRDKEKGLVHYAVNDNEAMQFFANPRFILLHERVKLLPGFRYQLETHLAITHEGMSRMFQFLDRWLSLNRPLDFVHLSDVTAN